MLELSLIAAGWVVVVGFAVAFVVGAARLNDPGGAALLEEERQMIRSALLRMKAERQAREEAQHARDIANARAAAQWALAQRALNGGRVQHTVTAVPKERN